MWGVLRVVVLFFFFKQKTAYEIYQCDWSSDVCSSDLVVLLFEALHLGDGFAVLGDPGGVAGFEGWRGVGDRKSVV